MIDIQRHKLPFKFIWIQKLFVNNHVSAWKYIEKMCLKENLFFCILRSNLKMNNMLIKKLAFLKNSKHSILTLKTILKTIDHHFDESYLWLNKLVKYQNKPIFIEEFYNVGIYDFQQLITSHGQLKSYDELAANLECELITMFFMKYVELIAANPTKWIQSFSLTNNFNCFKNNVTQIVFTLTTCKKAYCLLIEKTKILPRKQQNKWCEKLQITADSLNWQNIYENNYYATKATKLRSFQIRLNLRSVIK